VSSWPDCQVSCVYIQGVNTPKFFEGTIKILSMLVFKDGQKLKHRFLRPHEETAIILKTTILKETQTKSG